MRFRDTVAAEFERRRKHNPRYSLRGFARGMRVLETGDGSINGGIWPSPADGHSFVQLFVGVPNVEQSVAKATELGARVVVPPTTLPDGDTMAVLADPCGVTFGVMRRA